VTARVEQLEIKKENEEEVVVVVEEKNTFKLNLL
jgi:hypothetical protein